MSAPAEVLEEILTCALCDKEIFQDETSPVVNYIGQTFHRDCSLIYRIRLLETQFTRLEVSVKGLLAREVV